MGLSSKKQKTRQTNTPHYSPQILGAANAQQAAYDRSMPQINAYSDRLMGLSENLFSQYEQGDPTIQASQDWIQNTLALDPGANPHLDGMIALTGDNTRRAIQTQLGTRGGIGGSSERDIVSRALADNELGYRYRDYDATMARQAQAAGMAPGITAASYLPLDYGMRAGGAGAMLPLSAALANSAGVGGLLGQYQDVEGETRQSGGLLGDLLGTAAQIGSAAIMACDARLKENVEWVGMTPGGVPIYQFDYISGAKGVIGPMAQEVAELQPEALGPVIDGYMTVDMGALQ